MEGWKKAYYFFRQKKGKNLCNCLETSGYLIAITETHRAQDIAW